MEYIDEIDGLRVIGKLSTATNLKGINELKVEIQGETCKILLDEDSYWELDQFLRRYE